MDTTKTPSTVRVDINQLNIKPLYGTRITEQLLPDMMKAELGITRKRTRQELEEALRDGQGYEQPIKTAWVNSELVVLDGVLRTEVAQGYSKRVNKTVSVEIENYGGMTAQEAFVLAQSFNRQHGVQLTAEQKRLLDYRLYIINNSPILSSFEIAKVFGVGKTTGSKIRKCVEWFEAYQPEIQQHMKEGDIEKALEHMSAVLKEHFYSLDVEEGAIHSYNKLYEWITGTYTERDGTFDDVDACAHALEAVFKEYPHETVRKVLKRLRGELGITVKHKDINPDAYYIAFGDAKEPSVYF